MELLIVEEVVSRPFSSNANKCATHRYNMQEIRDHVHKGFTKLNNIPRYIAELLEIDLGRVFPVEEDYAKYYENFQIATLK